MQLLSEESFSIIEPLLTDDYKRVRSRLALLLNQADCEIFSAVDVLPNRGKWLSDSPVALSRYQAASPVEKEMIAAYIENAKARLLPAIAGHITGALARIKDHSMGWMFKNGTDVPEFNTIMATVSDIPESYPLMIKAKADIVRQLRDSGKLVVRGEELTRIVDSIRSQF